MDELFDALRDELKDEVTELETEFVPLVLDQIGDLAGVEQPIEVKVFGPEPELLRLDLQRAKPSIGHQAAEPLEVHRQDLQDFEGGQQRRGDLIGPVNRSILGATRARP